MTGCLYISPAYYADRPEAGCIPALLADTLITFKLPDGISGVDTTPAMVRWNQAGLVHRRKLGRKVHIVDGCATALAGDGQLIGEILGTLRDKLKYWQISGRPMRAYGDLANLYKSRGVLEVMGIWVPPNGGAFNSMTAYGNHSLGSLGLCSAIGSGGAALLDLARQFDPISAGMINSHVRERIRGFANAINGKRLANELLGILSDSTGGYVEYVYFDPDVWGWCRGPSALNLFFEVDIERSTSKLNRRAFAYEPSLGGRILTLDVGGEGGEALAADFSLEDGSISTRLDKWVGWRPQTASVTFYYRKPDGSGAWTSTISTRADQVHKIVLDIGASSFHFGMDDDLALELHDGFAREYARRAAVT